MELTQLRCGESAIISNLSQVDKAYRYKLLTMGLTCETPVRLVRVAPLGDPIQLEARGVALSVRKEEIKGLKVRRMPSE
jgi:ferrous iron transport protein A